jgi:hypothetical protein
VLTTASGNCGSYYYPADTASSGYNTYVGPDIFNPVSGWSQTLTVTDPGHWDVRANMPKGNTSVVGYPSDSQGASGDGKEQAIGAYTTIKSTFAEDMQATADTDAEAAYDIWTGAGDETMIQFDLSTLRPGCTPGVDPVRDTVSFAEPGTGTSQAWDFCEYGKERIWQLHGANEQSGSVDILAMLTWEQNHGYLPANATLGLVGFGFEICSTGGVPEDFRVTDFSLTALPNP